jgi:hypothetical protein
MSLMDHREFYKLFTAMLDRRADRLSQGERDQLEMLKNDIGLMSTLGEPLLEAATLVHCKYEIDGIEFCEDFPPDVCSELLGTPVDSCGTLPTDWASRTKWTP